MSPATLKYTLADYEHMIERGAFDWLRDRRIELIRGEIRELSFPTPMHSVVCTNLGDLSHRSGLLDDIMVRAKCPVAIPELDSAPEPDLVWVRRRDYSKRHPRSADVLLIIEVADATYDYDTGEKAELYAEAGIKDYWVVNLREYRVDVFRKPRRGAYTDRQSIEYESALAPLAFPKVKLAVERAFSVK
jgi:Uma2 family endonuclease